MDQTNQNNLRRAADAIATADALLITAGAGMGVDSGLPDFRGRDGFWQAYPALQAAQIAFEDIANPYTFASDPALAWGFYGHRLNLYRDTVPHDGFAILREWAEAKPSGYFVFTSNVDGHFAKAGFDPARISECHGSLHHLQCGSGDCAGAGAIWSADSVHIEVDEETVRAVGPLPACPHCGSVARPNVMMFNDYGWNPARNNAQGKRFDNWVSAVVEQGARLAIIECGAGRAIPGVRGLSERLARAFDTPLIRINPREADGPSRHTISLAMNARTALCALRDLLALRL